MNNREQINLNEKYKRFKKYSSFFCFNPEINTAKDIEKYYNKPISITHKECGRVMDLTLSKWFSLHSKNKNVTKENYLYLCNHCSKEYVEKNLQDFLSEKYHGDFVVVGDYTGSKKPIDIKHKSCGETFSKTPEMIYRDRLICKKCRKSDYIYEQKKQDEKNNYFDKQLKEAGMNEFKRCGDCISKSKPVKMYHERCGNYFTKSLSGLLKLKNTSLCPKCKENRFKSSLQSEKNQYFIEKLEKYHGDSFKLVGDYNGNENLVELEHKDCGNRFKEYGQTVIMNSYTCPYCNDRIKRSNHISYNQKIDMYEKELDYEYKILTPFTRETDSIQIMHKECGHKFKRSVSVFLKSKGTLLCPHCKNIDKYNNRVEKLNKLYDYKYEVISDPVFKTTDTIKIRHKDCGKTFDSYFKLLLSRKKEYCPHCNDKITSTEKLKAMVFKKYKGEYIVLGEYFKSNYKMSFRHKNCGKITRLTSKEFFDYKTPCKHCRKKGNPFTLKEAQERVNKRFGNLFTLHGEYKNSETDIPVKCNSCGNIFETSLATLLKKRRCPVCKTKKV